MCPGGRGGAEQPSNHETRWGFLRIDAAGASPCNPSKRLETSERYGKSDGPAPVLSERPRSWRQNVARCLAEALALGRPAGRVIEPYRADRRGPGPSLVFCRRRGGAGQHGRGRPGRRRDLALARRHQAAGKRRHAARGAGMPQLLQDQRRYAQPLGSHHRPVPLRRWQLGPDPCQFRSPSRWRARVAGLSARRRRNARGGRARAGTLDRAGFRAGGRRCGPGRVRHAQLRRMGPPPAMPGGRGAALADD
ncbi:hypothetical protein FQZ97_544360 [compost metagenome]